MVQNPKQDNHLELARDLSNRFIEVLEKKDPDIASRIGMLRDIAWQLDPAGLEKSPAQQRDTARQRLATFKMVMEFKKPAGMDDDHYPAYVQEKTTALLDAYARLGHLYEIAGQAARNNYFSNLRDKGIPLPGGVRQFIDSLPDIDTALGKLSQPVFEVVMTMHPTNTNSLNFMNAQRQLSKAVENGDNASISNAVEQFAAVPVLHQDEKGHDLNFTVRDETEIVINFLKNIYDDMPRVYSHFDRSLQRASTDPAKKFGAYNPLDLKLNFRFGSWGSSGDKDGNNSVTAETTLEAIALHTAAIIDKYWADLKALGSNPKLAEWTNKLEVISRNLHQDLLPELAMLTSMAETARNTRNKPLDFDPEKLHQNFEAISADLVKLRKQLDAKQFERDLTEAYAGVEQGKKQSVLDLVRKVRTFGFNFAKIEYRETAKEYSRVVASIVPGYDAMDPETRLQRLTELLSGEQNQAAMMLAEKKEEIIKNGAGYAYSKEDPRPIAYNTLKRMQLARDFPDMIQDNVLAECGRIEKGGKHSIKQVAAQGAANILEAKFVQRMAAGADGKTAHLGIVPLFEEPETMKNIDSIMQAAYRNPVYREHLESLKERNGDKVTQQVQIAHSDNARRSGLLAARALIHEAHRKLRELNDDPEFRIHTQFFEGGSISDAYRNGVRAISASVNAFDLQDFTKFTFQGGDLVNYFTSPSSTARLLTRIMTHSAKNFEKVGNEWKVQHVQKHERTPNEEMDRIAIKALIKTLDHYQKEDFNKDTMGVLLKALDYDAETRAGNRGSRAAARFASVSSTQAGVFHPVPIEDVRTIAFSEAWQHAGIVPSWIGSQKLKQSLAEAAAERVHELKMIDGALSPDQEELVNEFAKINKMDPSLTPQQLHTFYDKSPAFRDAQDRAAFALAMTDPESLKWLDKRMRHMADEYSDQPAAVKIIKGGYDYLLKLIGGGKGDEQSGGTYQRAGKLAYAAIVGSKLKSGDMRPAIASSLGTISKDIELKSQYRNFLLYTKMKGGLDDHQRGIVHNAGDTVMHGRFLAADDPTYGEDRHKREHGIGPQQQLLG